MMGKQKGTFPPGKYEHGLKFHIKAARGKSEPYLGITIFLTRQNVEKELQPQIRKFLRELDRRAAKRRV
jgi:hypothetical protein